MTNRAVRHCSRAFKFIGGHPSPCSRFSSCDSISQRSGLQHESRRFCSGATREVDRTESDLGLISRRGHRFTNEDAVLAVTTQKYVAAAVLDGHGGAAVADFAAERLAQLLQEDVVVEKPKTSAAPIDLASSALGRTEEAVRHEISMAARTTGATATLVVVDQAEIAVAWLGDSDAVLCKRDGSSGASGSDSCPLAVQRMTLPHRPERPSERQRIEADGGSVHRHSRALPNGSGFQFGPYRAYTAFGSGGLAVSRALGDLAMRPVVCGEPESARWSRDPVHDLFVIVASDGVWDVFTPEDAAAFVWDNGNGMVCPAEASKRLVDEAIARGSQDNASAAVVRLT